MRVAPGGACAEWCVLPADPLHDDTPESHRGARMPFRLAIAAILLLTGLAGVEIVRHELQRERVRVQEVATLRAGEVGVWVAERMDTARTLARAAYIAELLPAAIERPEARADLLDRLIELRRAHGAASVRLLDRQGGLVVADDPDERFAPGLLDELAARALSAGEPQLGPMQRLDAEAEVWRLDVVAPLTGTGARAPGLLVLRFDPPELLLPVLQTWPLTTGSGHSVLMQRHAGRRPRPMPFTTNTSRPRTILGAPSTPRMSGAARCSPPRGRCRWPVPPGGSWPV